MKSQRREEIRKILESKPFVSLRELTLEFPDVSEMTIRRDIEFFEREGEVIVTRNGYDVMHCISSAQHRINEEAIAKGRLLSRMMLAEDQISAGEVSDFDAFAAQMRERYGL